MKFGKYLLMFCGVVLVFYITGLTQDENCGDDLLCAGATPSSRLLNIMLNFQDINKSQLAVEVGIIFSLIVVTSIAVGFISGGKQELIVIAGFSSYILLISWDIIYVMMRVAAENIVFALLFFAPLMILYVITVVEWWRGITT